MAAAAPLRSYARRTAAHTPFPIYRSGGWYLPMPRLMIMMHAGSVGHIEQRGHNRMLVCPGTNFSHRGSIAHSTDDSSRRDGAVPTFQLRRSEPGASSAIQELREIETVIAREAGGLPGT